MTLVPRFTETPGRRRGTAALAGKILGVVEASITGKYEHEWTQEHTFSQW